eukprot:1832996-Rhodomonas_salina.3
MMCACPSKSASSSQTLANNPLLASSSSSSFSSAATFLTRASSSLSSSLSSSHFRRSFARSTSTLPLTDRLVVLLKCSSSPPALTVELLRLGFPPSASCPASLHSPASANRSGGLLAQTFESSDLLSGPSGAAGARTKTVSPPPIPIAPPPSLRGSLPAPLRARAPAWYQRMLRQCRTVRSSCVAPYMPRQYRCSEAFYAMRQYRAF